MDMLSVASEEFVSKNDSPKGEEPSQKRSKSQIIQCSTAMLQHLGIPAAFLGQKGEDTNEETAIQNMVLKGPSWRSVLYICSIAQA